MDNTILIISSYVIVFLLGRMHGIYGAKKIVDKSISDYFNKNK